MVSFKHLWQQADLSDCEIAICAEGTGEQLPYFPAHKAILSASPYFRAQAVRWASAASEEHATAEGDGRSSHTVSDSRGGNSGGNDGGSGGRSRLNGSSTSSDGYKKLPKLTLTMNSQPGVSQQDQVDAATAVLASLYNCGSPSALQDLDDSQLLQAAIIADMLQLNSISTAAVCLAQRTLLSAAAKQQYLTCTAWPDCLLPLLPVMARDVPLPNVVEAWCRNCLAEQQQACSSQSSSLLAQLQAAPQHDALLDLLLAQLGDLDRVWRDNKLQELLELPLPAVMIMLVSDKLKVSSEDNVLHTAQAYMDNRPAGKQKEQAQKQLAPLIRCPQLSKLWQLDVVLSYDDDDMLLSPYRPQLAAYMALGLVMSPDLQSPSKARDYITDPTCARWFLAPRQYSPLPDGGVQLQWCLSVAELSAASCRACDRRSTVVLRSSDAGSGLTPPLCGIRWRLQVQCVGQALGCGSKLGVYAEAVGVPPPAHIKFTFTVTSPGVSQDPTTSDGSSRNHNWGWPDYFQLNVMAGGWDAAAWAGKGLPAEGDLLLELKVTDVQPR